MDMSHGFIPQALDAALSALEALAAGDGLRSDDLIAGAIALEMLAHEGRHSHARTNGMNAAVFGLRILATRESVSGSEEGRRAAVNFADIVRDVRRFSIN
ncbi:hypothetical protein WDX82_004790 [Salmonella enterica]